VCVDYKYSLLNRLVSFSIFACLNMNFYNFVMPGLVFARLFYFFNIKILT